MNYNIEQFQGEEPNKELHTLDSSDCICNPFVETIEEYDVSQDTIIIKTALVHQEIKQEIQ